MIGSGEEVSLPKLKKYSEESDFVIAVDGGLNHLDKVSITPDIIIGDLDSVDKDILEKYPNVEIMRFNRDKELTDYDLALEYAFSLKPKRVYMFGSMGSFLDHSLANIIISEKYSEHNEGLQIITANATAYYIYKSSSIENMEGRRVSLFALMTATKLHLEGFQYEFKKSSLMPLEFSISNVINSNSARISFKSGIFLVILFDEGF